MAWHQRHRWRLLQARLALADGRRRTLLGSTQWWPGWVPCAALDGWPLVHPLGRRFDVAT